MVLSRSFPVPSGRVSTGTARPASPPPLGRMSANLPGELLASFCSKGLFQFAPQNLHDSMKDLGIFIVLFIGVGKTCAGNASLPTTVVTHNTALRSSVK